MPSKTPRGLPYPLPPEPVRDGALRIRELAEAIDADFIKAGRVDRQIEPNGFSRIEASECFFSNGAPAAIIPVGIHYAFHPSWDGFVDGGGALLRVYDQNGTQYAAGATVAYYWIAYRR